MCNKQRIKTREDLKFFNLTEAGSFSWSQNRGCKSTWCEWRPRRRWSRGLCSFLQRLSQCHLRVILIRMVYHLFRCYLRAILTRIIWSVVTSLIGQRENRAFVYCTRSSENKVHSRKYFDVKKKQFYDMWTKLARLKQKNDRKWNIYKYLPNKFKPSPSP